MLKVCKNVGRLVHSPQPATCLSSLVGGIIVGVHIVPNRQLACRVL